MGVFVLNIARFFVKIIIGLISCIEIPIFLITHPKIFKNEIIYVFWHWSFGHTILGLDYVSRLYYPHRISVIYIPHPGSNPYLPLCFQHNMDVFIYPSIVPFSRVFDSPRYRIMRFMLSVITALTERIQLIEQFNIYKTLSLAKNELFLGYEESGKFEKAIDWTGYIRFLKDNIGKTPRLPDTLIAKCHQEIIRIHPEFFDKPFVTLLLRVKYPEGGFGLFSTTVRCAGPQENYTEAVKFLTQNGYNVVGTGETNHAHFEHIPGYYSFKRVHIDPKLLNLFLLMNCKLFIGQHSGAFILPDSCGILCLLCDSLHYRIGTCRQEDILIFKHLRDRSTGKRLSYADVFKHHPDLAYGYHFKEKNIAIEPNSSEEILEAVKECYAIIHGQLELSDEDKRLCDAFRRLPSKDMVISYPGNRTSLHMLRRLKHQLLNEYEKDYKNVVSR